jgi:hypothetical protein
MDITEKINKWSSKVKTKYSPPEGLFTKDASTIATQLANDSTDLKQAMSRLNFYLNRAGKNLPSERKTEIEKAKKLLNQKFNESNDLLEKWMPANKLNSELSSMLRATRLMNFKTSKNGYNISVVMSKDNKGIKVTINDPKTPGKPESFLYVLKGIEEPEQKISDKERKTEKEFIRGLTGSLKAKSKKVPLTRKRF